MFFVIKNIYNHVGSGQHYGPRLHTTRRYWLLQALDRFWDHIAAMDSIVFKVAEFDGAIMICHTNSKMKD
jgi:hypothetical protein